MNPNPNSYNPTQNFIKHGLNASFRCSKHESIIKNHMHPVNQCRSWSFFTVFKRFWFFCSNLCSNENFCEFEGLQRLILVVNHEIFYGFQSFLGFHDFEQKLFESSTDLHRFVFVNVLEQERGKFQYSPVFYSEIRTGIFRNLWIWFCFVDFWLEFRK